MSTLSRPAGKTRAAVLVIGVLAAAMGLTCTTSTSPTQVVGPVVFGNQAPTFQFVEPADNISVNKGDNLVMRWEDSDPDSAAKITLDLVQQIPPGTETEGQIPAVYTLISGLEENDRLAPDEWMVNTSLVAEGSYYLRATISDGINPPVVVYAESAQGQGTRLLVTITPPGLAPTNAPPRVTVLEPVFNLAVAQDDALVVQVQPVAVQPVPPVPPIPYDPDDATTLYIVADLDDDPTNDDVRAPRPDELILLRTIQLPAGDSTVQPPAPITVDLTTTPPRPNGEPYFIRATIDDGVNPRVHAYAPGTINVVRAASGLVDLGKVGKTLAGVRWIGFNPGSNLGSTIERVGDFDADGVDDVVLVAQYGNPRNLGNIGEAYLVYGQSGRRYGGEINVNSVSTSVPGVIFEGPEVFPDVAFVINGFTGHTTMGITDAGVITDTDGDGRPELLFGMAHVDGAYFSLDFDPGDSDPPDGFVGCYPDLLPNNFSNAVNDCLNDHTRHWGGFGVVVSSQNRDNDGIVNPDRLADTVVTLDLVGATGTVGDFSGTIQRAEYPDDSTRTHGLRVQAGWYDYVDAFGLDQPPLNERFGWNVASMPDADNNQRPELIFSSPTNELDIENTLFDFGLESTHANIYSRRVRGSIFVFSTHPGDFLDGEDGWREKDGTCGSNTIPRMGPWGTCTTPLELRASIMPGASFQVFAEDVTDFLQDGSYAGDVNLDSIPDLLCGAPLNDLSASAQDTGATYVIYVRPFFDQADVRLSLADTQGQRPPMIRIRGRKAGDKVGWVQETALDVNGDRIDDIILGAPHADFGPLTNTTCADAITEDLLRTSVFEGCQATFGDDVFCDDLPCKLFDFNNDRLIDDDDRGVFDCLLVGGGSECCPVDNGFVGIVFGGITLDGDRSISQIATTDLPGVAFYGAHAGDLAGYDVASAGDFNHDGFGDILIAVPGRFEQAPNGQIRMGVAYLIFGGTHLSNRTFSLDQVGTDELPGIVILSPFEKDRPNEAPVETVSGIGDINNDLFDDIGIGIPMADFVDTTLPQDPNEPGTDPNIGRRPNDGSAYILYGSNIEGNVVETNN